MRRLLAQSRDDSLTTVSATLRTCQGSDTSCSQKSGSGGGVERAGSIEGAFNLREGSGSFACQRCASIAEAAISF